MNNENLSAVITIEEFPSRAEIITLLKDFIKENNYDPGYSCSNRSNGLTINFQESVRNKFLIIFKKFI